MSRRKSKRSPMKPCGAGKLPLGKGRRCIKVGGPAYLSFVRSGMLPPLRGTIFSSAKGRFVRAGRRTHKKYGGSSLYTKSFQTPRGHFRVLSGKKFYLRGSAAHKKLLRAGLLPMESKCLPYQTYDSVTKRCRTMSPLRGLKKYYK
jgi:hypothetical protein